RLSFEGEHVRDRPGLDRRDSGGRRGTPPVRPPRPHARRFVPVEETRGDVPPRVVHGVRGRLQALRGFVPGGHGQARRVVSDRLIAADASRGNMGFLQELAGRVEEVAAAGGKFADAFVRTAGATVSSALVFMEREIGYAQKAAKKRTGEKTESRK